MDAIDQHLEETGVKMTMRWDATRRSAQFYIAPGSLLAAMWVQFAEAISEQKQYGRCLLCDKPFEISTAQEGLERTADSAPTSTRTSSTTESAW